MCSIPLSSRKGIESSCKSHEGAEQREKKEEAQASISEKERDSWNIFMRSLTRDPVRLLLPFLALIAEKERERERAAPLTEQMIPLCGITRRNMGPLAALRRSQKESSSREKTGMAVVIPYVNASSSVHVYYYFLIVDFFISLCSITV